MSWPPLTPSNVGQSHEPVVGTVLPWMSAWVIPPQPWLSPEMYIAANGNVDAGACVFTLLFVTVMLLVGTGPEQGVGTPTNSAVSPRWPPLVPTSRIVFESSRKMPCTFPWMNIRIPDPLAEPEFGTLAVPIVLPVIRPWKTPPVDRDDEKTFTCCRYCPTSVPGVSVCGFVMV